MVFNFCMLKVLQSGTEYNCSLILIWLSSNMAKHWLFLTWRLFVIRQCLDYGNFNQFLHFLSVRSCSYLLCCCLTLRFDMGQDHSWINRTHQTDQDQTIPQLHIKLYTSIISKRITNRACIAKHAVFGEINCNAKLQKERGVALGTSLQGQMPSRQRIATRGCVNGRTAK